MFKRENEYDAETYEIAVPADTSEPNGPAVRIGVFDKVLVEISVEKVRLRLSRFGAGWNYQLTRLFLAA